MEHLHKLFDRELHAMFTYAQSKVKIKKYKLLTVKMSLINDAKKNAIL